MTERKQFSIWQLMKIVSIAAVVAYSLSQTTWHGGSLFADPVMFITVLAIALLLQSPLFSIASWIDWLLGAKPDKND